MGQGSRSLIVHVDLDSFFVAVERRRRPELSGRPVIVGGHPASHGRVVAASREARRRGVRVGMTLERAADRCPDAEFVDGAFTSYFAASARVDEILTLHSREVEWLSIDEVVVTLPSIAVAERVHRAIHDLGFDAAFGVAGSKLVARVAAQLGRPRGLVHVLDGYEARFLSPLKLEVLPGLDPALARRLRAHGVRRVGQIARMAEPSLTALCGRSAGALARQAAGIDRARVRRTALPWRAGRATTLFD